MGQALIFQAPFTLITLAFVGSISGHFTGSRCAYLSASEFQFVTFRRPDTGRHSDEGVAPDWPENPNVRNRSLHQRKPAFYGLPGDPRTEVLDLAFRLRCANDQCYEADTWLLCTWSEITPPHVQPERSQ